MWFGRSLCIHIVASTKVDDNCLLRKESRSYANGWSLPIRAQQMLAQHPHTHNHTHYHRHAQFSARFLREQRCNHRCFGRFVRVTMRIEIYRPLILNICIVFASFWSRRRPQWTTSIGGNVFHSIWGRFDGNTFSFTRSPRAPTASATHFTQPMYTYYPFIGA